MELVTLSRDGDFAVVDKDTEETYANFLNNGWIHTEPTEDTQDDLEAEGEGTQAQRRPGRPRKAS